MARIIEWADDPIEERRHHVRNSNGVMCTVFNYFGVLKNGTKLNLEPYDNRLPTPGECPELAVDVIPVNVTVEGLQATVRRAIDVG